MSIIDFVNDAAKVVTDFVRDTKNEALSTLAEKFINDQIKDYGKMVNLQIDSKNKIILLDVILKGEKEAINVKIENYEVIQKEGASFIKFKKVSASREWIQALLQNVVIPKAAPKHEIEIDPMYGTIINLLL